MATAAEIRNKAAKKLGILATGQTLRSEISADIDNAYKEVYALLEAEFVASWAFADEVPDRDVEAVVALVAGARVDEYSLPNDRYQRIVAVATGAVKQLKRHNAQPKTEETPMQNF